MVKTKRHDLYGRIHHPVLPYEHFVLENDPLHQVFTTFVIKNDDPHYMEFSARTMTDFLTSHYLSYLADDTFVPVKLTGLFPDYVVPQNEEDVFC